MKKANHSILIFLLFSSYTFAQDLFLKIIPESTNISIGLPATFKLSLESQTPFTLHGTFGVCSEHLFFDVRDQSGNFVPFAFTNPCPDSDTSAFDSRAKIQYDGKVIRDVAIYLDAGRYSVTARYSSVGPYLDRFSATDQRPVEGIWLGDIISNSIEINVAFPQGFDQPAWLNLATPTTSLESIASFLRKNGAEIVQKYPKSSYAAWLLWITGNSAFAEIGHESADKDFTFNFRVHKQELEVPGSIQHYKRITDRVIKYWGQLHNDFPNFVYRDRVLLGLAQTYFLVGEPELAITLIKELQQRFPDSEVTKESLAYRNVLIANKIWKD
jgi:hypothetical protein